MAKVSKADREDSIETLRKLLAPQQCPLKYVGTEHDNGCTIRKRVYTILRHVSRSGMSRRISVALAETNGMGEPYIRDITWHIANVLGYSCNDGSIKVDGGGMDMGFHVIYSLGRRLWPEGLPEPHGVRNGEYDRDGGYAISHQWL